jgi:ATP adenylyltransferase
VIQPFAEEALMDHLWAPWRAQYIRESAAAPPAEKTGCFLCAGLEGHSDRENYLVCRRQASVVYLNRYPYNNGHVLVAPTRHLGRITDFSGQDLVQPLETIQFVVAALDRLLKPHGYNIGLNQSRAAGAGVPDHLHWHIVPRWDGDTNFMPVLASTKVIVESLDDFYDRLRLELQDLR